MTRPELLSLAERLLARAADLTADIMTGPDHPNLQSELDRMNAARAMREAAALLRKLAELRPVGWGCIQSNGELVHDLVGSKADCEFWLASDDLPNVVRIAPIYQLSEVLTDA